MTLASIRQEAEEKYPDFVVGHRMLREARIAGRLDQAEADAQIADAFDWQSWSEPNRVITAAIRAEVAE